MADFAQNWLAGMAGGRQRRVEDDAMAKQQRINQLLAGAYKDPSQRQDALGSVAMEDAGMALQADQQFATRDESAFKKQQNIASIYANARPEARPFLRQQFGKVFTDAGISLDDPNFDNIVQSLAVQQQGASGKVVGNALVDPISGRVIYQGPEVPVNAQVVEIADGNGGTQQVMLDPRTRQTFAIPRPGGMPSPAAPPQPRPGALQPDSAEMAILKIEEQDGPLPPDVRQRLKAQMEGGGNFTVANRPGGAPTIGPDAVNPPSAQPAPAGGGPFGYTPPQPKSAPAPSGYRFSADGVSLEPIPGGPADKPATDKPLPVAALKLQLDATEALSVAEGVDSLLSTFEQQIARGELDFGPVKNLEYKARNAAGASSPQSQAFASFNSGLEKLRNDSLRLNTGVQTDGDAQRAWNELMAGINDTDLVKRRLGEIRKINARGVQLQREKLQAIEKNYRGATESAQEDDISDLMQMYGDNI